MIQLMQITIEGFGSIVDQITLPLSLSGIIRVTGFNGAGKTTLFNALTWALYGKNLKGSSDVSTWKQYRPKTYKGSKVSVTWNKDGEVFKVIRCYNYTDKVEDDAKGANRLLLYIDGQISPTKGKIGIQNEINKHLGFSYELFKSSIMFGQGMRRLIQESNQDKKKLFEEIFNLEYLNVARTLATNDRNYLTTIHRDNQVEINHLENRIESEKESLDDLTEQYKNFSKSISRDIQALNNELMSLNKTLEILKSKVSSKVESKQKILDKKIKSKNLELKHANNIKNIPIIELVSDVLRLIDKAAYKEARKKLMIVYESFKLSQRLQSEINQLRKESDLLRKDLLAQSRYQGEIKRTLSNRNRTEEKILQLKNKKAPEIDPKFSKKIKCLNRELTKLKNKQKELDKQLEDYNWVLNDPLSNNGIKAFIFDSSLGQLNDNLSKYADILGFRIEFNIDLESARKEFVTLIEKDGVIIEYEELSGGEKGLVNLTMCLALHETLTLSKDINLLLLDEVFENLDRDNIEIVISLLRELSQHKTIFLISHIENLPLGNCRHLMVSKKNGVTYYKGI